MMAWWKSLQQRERQMLTIGGVFVVIAFFYWVIWQPITESVAEQKVKVQTQQQLLSYVQNGTQRVKALQRATGKRADTNGTLTQWANQTARQQKINISRMQPQGESLQLWVDDVPFNSLMSWLGVLHDRHGIVIESFDVSVGDEPGMVRVRRLQIGKPI